jgi:hypothetical protein
MLPSDMPSDAPSMVPTDVPSTMPSDMPSTAPSNTPNLAPSGDVPSFEPSASLSTAPSSSETAELEEPMADYRDDPDPDVTAPEQTRSLKISTVAIVTGALAFATAMGAGIYYYLKKTRELEEPDM